MKLPDNFYTENEILAKHFVNYNTPRSL